MQRKSFPYPTNGRRRAADSLNAKINAANLDIQDGWPTGIDLRQDDTWPQRSIDDEQVHEVDE